MKEDLDGQHNRRMARLHPLEISSSPGAGRSWQLWVGAGRETHRPFLVIAPQLAAETGEACTADARGRDVGATRQAGTWLRLGAGVAAAACAALLTAACAGSTTLPAVSTATAANTSTATAMTTATPTAIAALTVTAAQSVAVAEALFPWSTTMGGYTECDTSLDSTEGWSACPFDARLRNQVAIYAANWQQLCPQGCVGGAGLFLGQCPTFANRSITTGANPAVAIVMLTGQVCGISEQLMYVSVVLEGGQPLADDVECNAQEPQYGMYNSDPNAIGGDGCAGAP